ncbi:cation diffusion facilitator family transporter [Chitinophaga costaii]|uniref:Cation diffusion facilitator family transporter n=1 Tax=Chitinophaga costaii TaxID=1335309 RepID=A0A1C4EFE8_9BACT|nr:cation diffusion facilitator family transporter [Chitinophaga costaii]PUZ23933.1 cation transporter [Chitinophaga costaii]SCC42339.1 cation diffusion facilitator family transporter [Chitinophaga costaii]
MQTTNVHPSVKAMRTTLLGIVISIVLVFVKLAAGYFGHSYALVADASETASDVLSSGLLWIGLRIAMKPADKEHPYGHGKAEPLAAVLISLFLLGAAIWIGWHAITFIRTPHQLPQRFTLAILGAVIFIKEAMFRYVLKVGQEINSQAVKSDAYHHRSDAITSMAAFVGILVAILLGKGYEAADDWAALIASGIIGYNAIALLRPALNEVMDAAPGAEIVEKVRVLASGLPDVEQVEKCYVRKMGFEYFVDIHIQVQGSLSVKEGHDIAHAVKNTLLQSELHIKDVLVHIEPA